MNATDTVKRVVSGALLAGGFAFAGLVIAGTYKGQLPSTLWDGEIPPPDSEPPCGTDMFTGRPGNC